MIINHRVNLYFCVFLRESVSMSRGKLEAPSAFDYLTAPFLYIRSLIGNFFGRIVKWIRGEEGKSANVNEISQKIFENKKRNVKNPPS